jgi:hypothetical protein
VDNRSSLPANFPNFMVSPQNNQPGNVRNGSESFRTVPHGSETFGKFPNDSARFGSVPHPSERKESHTLTVREAARMFEAAGVARTERSITNWCQPNRAGIPRLDAYFDPNERKYYISPQSVELAIAEEKAKAAKINDPSESFGMLPQNSEPFRAVPNDAETVKINQPAPAGDESRVKELERENLDLRITNRGKDMYIEQLKLEQDRFVGQLLDATHKLGVLETKLLQIESPEPRLIEVSQIDGPSKN